MLEECRRDNMTVKQRLVDTENAKETAAREVGLLKRRLSELDEEMRVKEKEFQTNIETIRKAEQKATDKVHNLENLLENTHQDLSEQKLKFSGAEGRIAGLEAQLARTEGAKNDVEVKLANLHSTLRRTLGIRAGGNG
jgi:chromosome segregation ATPase